MKFKGLELFYRCLGVTYAIALASLWPQFDGLIGDNGILPLGTFLSSVYRQVGNLSLYYIPSLSWIDNSIIFCKFLCILGLILSILLILGFRHRSIRIILWMIYLSLSLDFQDFLSFQWDILLTEVGFLSIFLEFERNSSIIWCFRVLLFKLMFSSGLVKLSSGDENWRSLSALNFHFLTQPLPVVNSWYMSQLNPKILKVLCAGMFFVELVAPCLIFLGSKMRKISSLFIILLMIVILLTGNYAFFNILTIFLCIFLWIETPSKANAWKWSLAGIYIALSCSQVLEASRIFPLPRILEMPEELLSPFRSINGYGLFQVMTTQRFEIEIQGSDTPKIESSWKSYEFKYKPGALDRPPQWCQPYQPRLDWQMWFAALGRADENPWYQNLLYRLLQGRPEVLGLLDNNPFPGKPPKYLRGLFYEYHFSSPEELKTKGLWWDRKAMGLYSRPVFLTVN